MTDNDSFDSSDIHVLSDSERSMVEQNFSKRKAVERLVTDMEIASRLPGLTRAQGDRLRVGAAWILKEFNAGKFD